MQQSSVRRDAASDLADARRRRPILAFGSEAWSDYWQVRQHVLSRLAARGWTVGYSYGALSLWDRAQLRWRDAAWGERTGLDAGVRIYWPGRWPPRWPRCPAWDRHIVRHHARRFHAAVGRPGLAAGTIVYVFHPRFWPYVTEFNDARIVFHADDNFAAMPGWTDELASMQDALVSRADAIFAISEGVVAALPRAAASRVVRVPNGADAAAFRLGQALPCPPDLQAIPRPRLGYTGTLNDKVDFALLAELARARPDWHWVLIGHELPSTLMGAASRRYRQACHDLSNVHFLGQRPYSDLPAYCAHMDANVLCYRCNGTGWWRDIYPMKLHEYLATGRPVVAAPVPTVLPHRDVIALADSPEAWLGAIDEALRSGGVGTVEARIAVASANDWNARIDIIEAELASVA